MLQQVPESGSLHTIAANDCSDVRPDPAERRGEEPPVRVRRDVREVSDERIEGAPGALAALVRGVTLAATALIAAGCGGDDDDSGDSGEPIRIGGLCP